MADWLKKACFYEIYPQSFNDTNADGIGDFQGITEKLPYIKELGCNAIWINPCFFSPFGDAGYDVADYYRVAPRYGTNEDLKNLFEAAHKLDMHVLLDLVPGHTSIEHPWFKESMKAEKNEYTDRYIWTDSAWEVPQGMNYASGISDRDGVVAMNFFSCQPALNYGFYEITRPWQQPMDAEGPQASLEEMKNVMRFWLTMGADGFRVDMAGAMVKQDPEGKGTIALWQKVRAFLDQEFPEAVMVSEWGEPDKALQGGFHMDFLLHFGPSHYNDLFRCEHPYFSKEGKGDVSAFVEKYLDSYAKAQRKGLICIPSGNHDMDRLARSLSEEEMKVAFAFLLSMPGAPFIYYGDEIGMHYVEGLTSKEGGFNRTGSRTPMQWNHGVNSGFSNAPKDMLYLPQDPDHNRPTAEDQMANPDSLYHEIQKLINIRNTYEALQNIGEIQFVYVEKDAYPLAYIREYNGESILVIINPANREVSFPCSFSFGECIYHFGTAPTQQANQVTVSPMSASFIKVAR